MKTSTQGSIQEIRLCKHAFHFGHHILHPDIRNLSSRNENHLTRQNPLLE